MLGLKLMHVNNGGPWNIPAPAPGGGSYVPECSAFYTTVDASGSFCDSFSVLDGLETLLERFYWWQRRQCDDWVSFSTETDMFFILFTSANDKRYLTLYKLVISITISSIIINKSYATISGVADENIDDVGNLPSEKNDYLIRTRLRLRIYL